MNSCYVFYFGRVAVRSSWWYVCMYVYMYVLCNMNLFFFNMCAFYFSLFILVLFYLFEYVLIYLFIYLFIMLSFVQSFYGFSSLFLLRTTDLFGRGLS